MLKVLALAGAALCASSCAIVEEGGGGCWESRRAPEIGGWSDEAAAFEARVLELTNAERRSGGCCGSKGCFPPSRELTADANLTVSARRHARDMSDRNYFSHDAPDGTGLRQRLEAAGFGGCAAAENIAQGYSSPEAVVAGWMRSDGHCANLLSDTYDRLGVGFYDDPDAELREFWVQNFGG